MKSLKQYIDLYTENCDLVMSRLSALDTLRTPAKEALEAFVATDAPRSSYSESSQEQLLSPDYGLNLSGINFGADVAATFRCGVPNVSSLLALVVNDLFRPTDSLLAHVPEGLEVCSLAETARKYPEIVKTYLNKLAANSTPAIALNNLFLHDGVFVHAKEGCICERPLQIVNIFSAPMPLMAPRRILVVAEPNSSLRILLCDHSQNADIPYLSNEVVEVFCGRGSHVEIYSIEESSNKTQRIGSFYAQQEEGSVLTVSANTLNCGISTNTYNIQLVGAHAETRLGGLVIAEGQQVIENVIHMRHSASDTTSRQLFKYALFEQARGSFGGKIVVDEGAVRTDAAQTNRNLLASDGARMATAPQLEIYCDDVQCSHGATTGQLDENQLFYMQARGIPREEARMMLTQAFMADVVDGISYELIRDRLRQLVEKRLGGERAGCAACASDKTCHK